MKDALSVLSVEAYKNDAEVEAKHPFVYKKLFNFAKENKRTCTIDEIMVGISRSASESIVKSILDSVSWATKISNGKYSFSPGRTGFDYSKFVRNQKDQQLKNKYGLRLNDVFYALKKHTAENKRGATSTDIFLTLNRSLMRKEVFEILTNASWSKSVAGDRFVFYDSEEEERKRKAVEENMKKAENEFFTWLPSALSPHVLEDVKRLYLPINTILIQKKLLPQSLIATTQIGQVESAQKEIKSVIVGKRMRHVATILLNAYLSYLREQKNIHSHSESSDSEETSEDWIRFDATNASVFEKTVPISCCVGGEKVEGKNWARIFVLLVEREIVKNNDALLVLYKKSLSTKKENSPFFMKNEIKGQNCERLSNDYWINLNYSIPKLIQQIYEFCLHCGYDKNQIILYGVKKRGSDEPRYSNERTILDAVFMVLRDAQTPLTLKQIHQAIIERRLYQFNTSNSIGMVQTTVYRHCLKANELIRRGESAIISTTVDGQKKYVLQTSDFSKNVSVGKNDHADPFRSASPIEIQSRQIEEAESIVLSSDLDGIRLEELAQKIKVSVVGTRRIVQGSMSIVAVQDKLIHKQAFMDWDEGAQQLEFILDKLMQKNDGYVSDVQLYEYARATMELFLNDNDMDDVRKVYDLAEHLFSKEGYHGKRYSFSGRTHISRENESVVSKLDIIRKYARDAGGVFEEKALEDYLRGLGVKTGSLRQLMRIFSEPIFLMYTPGVFISVESMKIDDSWLNKTSRALEILFDDVGDHIVLRDISPGWFALLPELPGSRPWTPLLLQYALFHYGEILKAKTISALAGQAADTLHAMLIRNDSEMRTFSDAVIAVFVDSSIEKRSFEAEELRQLLLSKGLISGNELIWNMPKALPNDEHFSWDSTGEHVAVQI